MQVCRSISGSLNASGVMSGNTRIGVFASAWKKLGRSRVVRASKLLARFFSQVRSAIRSIEESFKTDDNFASQLKVTCSLPICDSLTN